jgi:hypothetical protein
MSITPEKRRLIIKEINFLENDLTGDKLAQVNVLIENNKKINLILNNDIILKFDFKEDKNDRKFIELKKSCFKKFKLLVPQNNKILKEILFSEMEIRTKINEDKNKNNDRPLSEEKDFLGGIDRRSNDILSWGKKLGLDLFYKHSEFYCKRCHAFRAGPGLPSSQKEEKVICLKCRNLLSEKRLVHVAKDFFPYLNGDWLEDYIAITLNRLGWMAWSSPTLMVYGVSSQPHQIDVLAIKNGKIIIVECKTTRFNPIDVKNILAKYYDIRCHYAILVSLPKINIEAQKLIEKNPAIKLCDDIKNISKIKKILYKL